MDIPLGNTAVHKPDDYPVHALPRGTPGPVGIGVYLFNTESVALRIREPEAIPRAIINHLPNRNKRSLHNYRKDGVTLGD